MAYIRREKMGYKSNYVVQNFKWYLSIPADHYLVSIYNTGRRHQQSKTISFFNVNAFMNSSVIDTWNKLPDTAINAANIHDFKDRLTHDLFNKCNK